MKKRTLVALLLVLVLLLAGCDSASFDNDEVRADTEAVLDALIDGNYMALRAAIHEDVTDEELNPFFTEISPVLRELDSYELTAVNLKRSYKDGVDTIAVAYELTAGGTVFDVESVKIVGEPGLRAFSLNSRQEESASESQEAPRSAIHWVFTAVALVTFAFVIWMIVDCARRKMKRKWLWIALILLLTLLLTFRFENGNLNFHFNLGLFLGSSYVKIYTDGSFAAQVYVPLGALIYLTQRKKLTICEEAPEEPEQELPQQTPEESLPVISEELPEADEKTE